MVTKAFEVESSPGRPARQVQGPAAWPRRSPSNLAAALHVFGLSNLAVAEPLFDLLSRQAEFLIAHDAQPLDLVLIVLLLSVALPVSLVLLTRWVAWCLPPAQRWVNLAQVIGLVGLIMLQLANRLAPTAPGGLLIAAATALAVATGVCYRHWSAVRTFFTFVSPVALLSPTLFLLTSPVRQMLLPEAAERRALASSGARSGAPVVMVILDSLPLSSLLDEVDEIDPLRYPNLAALAGDAYWFRDATTVSYVTNLSVPIILSGRIPDQMLLPWVEHYPDNLFTWLAGAGYQLNVIEAVTRLCPPELCLQAPAQRAFERFDAVATDLAVIYLHLLLPTDLSGRVPTIDANWRDFAEFTIGTRLRQLLGIAPESAHDVSDRDDSGPMSHFLDAIVADHRPMLHFIHLTLPHVPWRYLPSGREYGPVTSMPPGVIHRRWSADPWQVTQGFQRHLLQVGYVDTLIGQLLARLQQQDLYDPALIVLVADHGTAFRPQAPRRAPGAGRYADILNVPLLVKLPGQREGVRSERNVETIDVLPTIADALGLVLPWPSDGHSALDAKPVERRQKVLLKGFRGKPIQRRSVDIESLRAERQETVARKLHLFGSGARLDGLYQIGRWADLIGRRVSDLDVVTVAPTGESMAEIELTHAMAYEQVDPGGSFIPAQVEGRVHFAQERDVAMELAVALNGTVEAVTQTFDHADARAGFTAMVRDQAFIPGRNRVEIFEIRDRRRSAMLVATRRRAAEFVLVGQPGEEMIRSAAGLEIPLVEGYLQGRATLRRSNRGPRLAGWARTGANREPAETLLVFVDGRLATVAANGMPSRHRRARAMPPWQRESSFRIYLPENLTTNREKIRLFAILGDAASEIPLRPKPPPG